MKITKEFIRKIILEHSDEFIDALGDKGLPPHKRFDIDFGAGTEADMTPNLELELENIVTHMLEDEGITPDAVLAIVNDVISDLRSNRNSMVQETQRGDK